MRICPINYGCQNVSFSANIIDSHCHIGQDIAPDSGKVFSLDYLSQVLRNKFDIYIKGVKQTDEVVYSFVSNLSAIAAHENGEPVADEIAGNKDLLKQIEGNARFKALAVCQPGIGNAENIDTLLRENEGKIFGLKFHPEFLGKAADDISYVPYLKLAEKYNLPCVFHSDKLGSYADPKSIYEAAKQIPKVPVVLYHMSLAPGCLIKDLTETDREKPEIKKLENECYEKIEKEFSEKIKKLKEQLIKILKEQLKEKLKENNEEILKENSEFKLIEKIKDFGIKRIIEKIKYANEEKLKEYGKEILEEVEKFEKKPVWEIREAWNRDGIKTVEEAVKNGDANLYLEVSWTKPETVIEAIEAVGEDRVIWGTDTPFMELGSNIEKYYQERVQQVKNAIMDRYSADGERKIQKIFYDNSYEIFIAKKWAGNIEEKIEGKIQDKAVKSVQEVSASAGKSKNKLIAFSALTILAVAGLYKYYLAPSDKQVTDYPVAELPTALPAPETVQKSNMTDFLKKFDAKI